MTTQIPLDYITHAPKRSFVQRIFDRYRKSAVDRYAKELEYHNLLANAAVRVHRAEEMCWQVRQRYLLQWAIILVLLVVIIRLGVKLIEK